MESFVIKPWRGIRSNVPQNDPTLLEMVGNNVAIAHCVDGMNIDFQRKRNACSKSRGKTAWSNSAAAGAAKCLGTFYLKDGSNTARFFIDGTASGGRIFKYDGSNDPVRICDTASCGGTPVEFANSAMDLYSVLRVGSYMVFSDYGEHTPYCMVYNGTTLSKLVSADTEYQARYLAYFGNRILMANVTSGVTVGDISVIWSNVNPTPASSCTFGSGDPPANHLYKPDDDTITGIKLMGRNACYVYGENSIDALDYYQDYAVPFAFRSVVSGQGAVSHHSIVNVGGMHYLYNRNYGFCVFDGTSKFPAGGVPISQPIEDKIATINADYANWINGVLIPKTQEIAWTVPLEGSSTPTHILFFNIVDGTWRVEDKVAYFLDFQKTATDLTWTDLVALGYTTWSDLGTARWSDFVQTFDRLMLANTDGHLYSYTSETDAGSPIDGYRVEPILDFGRPNDKDVLLEIWFDLAEVGDYNMYCSYRSGDSVGEVESAAWNTLPEMSLNSPDNAVIRMPNDYCTASRYHQIKWGTDGADEPFAVNSIEFRYVPQGRY